MILQVPASISRSGIFQKPCRQDLKTGALGGAQLLQRATTTNACSLFRGSPRSKRIKPQKVRDCQLLLLSCREPPLGSRVWHCEAHRRSCVQKNSTFLGSGFVASQACLLMENNERAQIFEYLSSGQLALVRCVCICSNLSQPSHFFEVPNMAGRPSRSLQPNILGLWT